ncbi:hypothetical protein [Kitasatospora sp. NPDC096204]
MACHPAPAIHVPPATAAPASYEEPRDEPYEQPYEEPRKEATA